MKALIAAQAEAIERLRPFRTGSAGGMRLVLAVRCGRCYEGHVADVRVHTTERDGRRAILETKVGDDWVEAFVLYGQRKRAQDLPYPRHGHLSDEQWGVVLGHTTTPEAIPTWCVRCGPRRSIELPTILAKAKTAEVRGVVDRSTRV